MGESQHLCGAGDNLRKDIAASTNHGSMLGGEVYRREGELIRMSMIVRPAAMIYSRQHKFHSSPHTALLAVFGCSPLPSASRLRFALPGVLNIHRYNAQPKKGSG